jgi:long-chain acyl-CoA synthetase
MEGLPKPGVGMTVTTTGDIQSDAAWGRGTVEEQIGDSVFRVYAERRRHVAGLLIDARRWSDRMHAVQGERQLTFTQHETAVARTAGLLRTHGVRPGSRVVLLGRNCLEGTLAFWAVHAIGAVAVLANAWWSAAEVSNAFSTFSPVLVVHAPEAAHLLPAGVRTLEYDSVAEVTRDLSQPETVSLPLVDEGSPALAIFTSGSTGAAKGVLLSQRSVIANLQNLLLMTRRLPSELADDYDPGVNLLSVPLFHLSGVQVVCSGLLTGAKLVYQAGRFDAGEVLRLIEQERVTTWGAVPAMVTRVLEHPDFARHDLTSLRSIPLGGSSANPGFRERVQRSFPALKGGGAGSLYGFTEAGGLVAMGTARDLAGRPGSVGKILPIVDVRIDVPDDAGSGEIVVHTPGAMSGFINGDPAPLDAQGWLRSGDLGRVDDDGYLYLTGRIKDIIIRGGENISCAHVEQALISHPDVAEVLVVGLPHEELQEQVGAVVCLRPGAAVTAEELRACAARSLGRFQLPTRWWLRSTLLPTNAQGKIVRYQVRDEWLARGNHDISDLDAQSSESAQ